jgi:hypothetical protein
MAILIGVCCTVRPVLLSKMLMLDGEYNNWVDWKTTLNHVNDVGEVVDFQENCVHDFEEEENYVHDFEEEEKLLSDDEQKTESDLEAEVEAEATETHPKKKERKRLGDLIEEQALWLMNRDRVCSLFFVVV